MDKDLKEVGINIIHIHYIVKKQRTYIELHLVIKIKQLILQ